MEELPELKKIAYLNFRRDRGIYLTRYPIPDELRKHYSTGGGKQKKHLVVSIGDGSAKSIKEKHRDNIHTLELEFDEMRTQGSSLSSANREERKRRRHLTFEDKIKSRATSCTISESGMSLLISEWYEGYYNEQLETLKHFIRTHEDPTLEIKGSVYTHHDYKLELYAYHAKLSRGVDLKDPDLVEDPLEVEELKNLLLEKGIDIGQTSYEFMKMKRLIGEILIGLYEWLVDCFDSGSVKIREIAPHVFKELREMRKLLGDPSLPSSRSSATPTKLNNGSSMTLRELVERFHKQKNTAAKSSKKGEGEQNLISRFLFEFFGKQKQIRTLEESDFIKLWKTISELPDRKGKKFKDVSFKESIKIAKKDKDRLLSHSTANRYRNQIHQIFEYAADRRLVEGYEFRILGKSYTKKNRISNQVPQKVERFHFNEDQLQKIFSSPVFTGCRGSSHGSLVKGNKLFWNKRYWGCLIALFTGLRPAEIAQTRISQIKEEEGILYFDIDTIYEDQSLKTSGSTRKTPIHSTLIKLGLLDYIRGRSQDSLILHEIGRVKDPKDRSRNLTRWFNGQLLPQLGLKTGLNKEVFYCFRHSFATYGIREGLSGELKEICGWSSGEMAHYQKSMLANYTKGGYGIKLLKESIEKIQYPFIDFEPMMPRNLKPIRRYEFEVG